MLHTLFTKSYGYWWTTQILGEVGFFCLVFFFCEILGQHYLRQAKTMEATSKWNQSHVHKKKKIKPKVSHTSFFISKDQNQIIQIFNYTFQQKCKLIKRGDNCELTLSEVLCSWRQTDFSFFVSVCS